jgi:CDP-glucose 4,6-dehydratase
MDAAFWKDKRVLITGHTGFKGSWLSLWLQGKGTRVIGYALPPPTTPSFFEIGEIASSMVSVEGDVRDLPHLIEVIENHEPELLWPPSRWCDIHTGIHWRPMKPM